MIISVIQGGDMILREMLISVYSYLGREMAYQFVLGNEEIKTREGNFDEF